MFKVSIALVALWFLVALHGCAIREYENNRARLSASIDDLELRIEDVLASSPDVAKVEVVVRVPHPAHRIIHVLDSHYLSREEYRLSRRPATEEGYREHVGAIEALIHHQHDFLCWLADVYSLREVHQESVSQVRLERFIEDNRKFHEKWQQSRPELRDRIAQLREAIELAERQGKDATDLRKQERAAEKAFHWRLTQGAVRNLLISRPDVRILPAEDEEAFQAGLCKIVACIQGKTTWRGPENDRREASIVANLLTRRCAVIVLGRAHDLSKEIQIQGGGKCEYIRVTPKGFPKKIEQNGRRTWASE